MVRSEISAAWTHSDNKPIITTDAIKNTVRELELACLFVGTGRADGVACADLRQGQDEPPRPPGRDVRARARDALRDPLCEHFYSTAKGGMSNMPVAFW